MKSALEKWLVIGSLVISVPIIFYGVNTLIAPEHAKSSKIERGGREMQRSEVPTITVKSANHSIVAAKQSNYTSFDDMKKVVTFKVKVPKKLP